MYLFAFRACFTAVDCHCLRITIDEVRSILSKSPMDRTTDRRKNIIFPQLRLRTVERWCKCVNDIIAMHKFGVVNVIWYHWRNVKGSLKTTRCHFSGLTAPRCQHILVKVCSHGKVKFQEVFYVYARQNVTVQQNLEFKAKSSTFSDTKCVYFTSYVWVFSCFHKTVGILWSQKTSQIQFDTTYLVENYL